MSIQLNNVSYTYMARTPFEKQAIKNINLEIKKGEFVAIIGHTGSGKSTLVQHLNGLLKPTNGSITIDEIVLGKKDEKSKLARKKVGMVFQYPEHQLFEETIYADIAFGPKNLGLGKKEIDKRVRRAMNFVNLDYDMYKERSPFQLSGGQMRRVAIAGVVALQPDYLVLDEPAAGLDPCGRDAIFNKIVELHKKTGIAVILVSHNMDDVAKMASRLIVMKSGEVAVDGKPADVFKETETLVNTGLDIPQIISLMRALEKRGLPVNTDVLTINQAVDSILSALRGKNHAK
ncbi:energy-coupling factor transporter ATPase [Anaerosinus gibii]|uniref:Energy-coupling factor transporter ATP-binding protein EcfA2 n=1 Tax=Selenobaculum gibii TaxID=3054208 RepID=A0A9Y2AIJ0_9FIRM|nr:energy-coupling factor transporter ATPase [Selenobaculum gbiensis]WIW70065.1 energy-coupling factor transporter ATPase [Selenobaculum gbiensis]